MDGLIVGIDLCDEYTQMNCSEQEKTWTIPTVLCKNKNTDAWYVGEEAYAHTLKGDGVIVDQLVKLVSKEGTATIGEIRYEAQDLLKRFLELILRLPEQEYGILGIKQLVITVEKLNLTLMKALYFCAEELGIPRERVQVISQSESFIYYILSQKKEIWTGTVGMFDLSEKRLRYYELKVQRGGKQAGVVAEYEDLEEAFSLDILKTPSGAKLADTILTSCGERMMQKKLYSAVFLTGKGFLERDWAEEFMKLVCTKRRVYMETGVFARGAAYRAQDLLQEKTAFPYTCICEGRLKTNVSMNVFHRGQETSVVMASAGDNWYEQTSVIDVIPERQDCIELVVTSPDSKNKKTVSIPLEGFPERPERTTRVAVQISFLDEHTMAVKLTDKGFGELFPSSGIEIRQEVML